MAVTSTVIWRPERLNARLIAAARAAASDFAKAAAIRAPSKRVAASMKVLGSGTTFSVGPADPLGLLFERGVGPHLIEPKRTALKLADGGFVSGPVEHPGMRAQPFLRPTLPLWPNLYRRQAAQSFRGF